MAHSPEKKAEAVADLVSGMGWDAAAAKHKVSKATLKSWLDQTRSEQKPNKTELSEQPQTVGAQGRRDRFNTALTDFLHSTLVMLHAWAETCSDPDFIRENPSGVNELGGTVLDRADKLVSILGTGQSDDGPG